MDDDEIKVLIHMQDGNQRYVPIITEVDTGAKPSTINLDTYKEHFGFNEGEADSRFLHQL